MPFIVSLFFTFFFAVTSSFSQSANIPLGTWRMFPSCHTMKCVAAGDHEVYACDGIAFIRYDKESKELKILSEQEGFSDVNVSCVKYNAFNQTTLVAYVNGNIDLVKNGEIVNIEDIKMKSLQGSKAINQITFQGDMAYLSTDFGLVVLDMKHEEIKISCMNIGSNGTSIQVLGSALISDSIFVLSSEGIKAANLSTNLLNFSNWTSIINSPNSVGIAALDNQVFVGINHPDTTMDSSGIYKLSGNQLIQLVKSDKKINSLVFSKNKIVACGDFIYYTYDGNQIDSMAFGAKIWDIAYDNDGYLWIATEGTGLQSNVLGYFKPFIPASPSFNSSFHLSYFNNTLINLYGGYLSNTINMFSTQGFDVYNDGIWTNYSYMNHTFPASYDLCDAAYNSHNGNLYIASYGYGVFEMKDMKVIDTFNNVNSPLVNMVKGAKYVRVPAIAVDSSGSLWVPNCIKTESAPFLHKRMLDGSWHSYSLSGLSGQQDIREIVIDGNNNKWITLKRGQIIVFNENYNGTNTQKLRIIDGGGGDAGLSGSTLCILADLQGDVWVGTDKGLAIFKHDSDPFTDNCVIPYLDGFPILMQKSVTAIAMDGANRKWVASNQGITLYSENADSAFSTFTAETTPLLSNTITDMQIQHETGELFIVTSLGLCSYRGTGSFSNASSFSNVEVFPNPVKRNFDGLVGITGLASGASVKITDVFGNMIFDTKAEGGTASWNVRNYNGERAETGVYLIFSVSVDGKEGYVAKVAVE